ncbi:putative ras-domain-containing protein [Lyophyllum shimeji]|uniref:Ras-domain-containing protein n=1 Tax=Lyophyllum shimeji TaxID=47721 RepID=A0A9P3PU20_LYOSH|nr:putative ras-domain-containing protein [Lyophyllum shimeji]
MLADDDYDKHDAQSSLSSAHPALERRVSAARTTIGADFITKTLPHPSDPADTVTPQIWDTAGQQRFSSLSSAFFRGADAALLMFDVNTPETMTALTKWWAEFRERAPLADKDRREEWEGPVTEAEAHEFLSNHSAELQVTLADIRFLVAGRAFAGGHHPAVATTNALPLPCHLAHRPPRILLLTLTFILLETPPFKSRSRSSSHFYSGAMTTTHATLTIYHTPSSSLFDVYQSARSSPEPWSSASSSASSSAHPRRQGTTRKRRSTGSASSESAATVKPGLFAREHASSSASLASQTAEDHHPAPDLCAPTPFPVPPPPARGPKLFFTSAKRGEGVADVFEYIAARGGAAVGV